MRRFHNNVKRQLYDKYTRNIDKLLDLACGKGGDLDKWVSNNIKNVVGYDINEISILEARRRVSEYKSSSNNKQIKVYVKDLSKDIIKGSNDSDVISSMFAFHYFFKSEETFDTIMKSINENLKEGGYFIGTMFDGESLKRILNDGDYTMMDKNEVKFNIKTYKPLTDELFGNKISVYLKDTVLDEPMDEYVVYFDKFVDIMKLRGYELVDTKMFKELDKNSILNEVEKGVSYLNRYFVFKKRFNSLCKQESNYLTECDWPLDIKSLRRSNILEKYMKALSNKIRDASSKSKGDYIFIRENFEKGEELWNNESISKQVRDYYKIIYGMFLEDVDR